MKRFIYITFLFTGFVFGQTTPNVDENYILGTTYLSPFNMGFEHNALNEEKIENIAYVDGLGRPLQNVAIRAGGNGEDLVTPMQYDPLGRTEKEYLPLPVASNNGSYYSGTLGTGIINELKTYYKTKFPEDFYQGSNHIPDWDNPYSQKSFEKSPLSRVLEQGAPGYDWRVGFSGEHTIRMDYQTNTANEVRIFRVSLAGGSSNPQFSYIGGSHYLAGKLAKNITKDENWQTTDGDNNTSQAFTNLAGQVILKRTFTNNLAHDTYYVYDDFGNLTYVLSPEASEKIVDSNGNLVGNYQTILNELGYQYRYDSRNRLIEKKVPGKDWEFIVYNKLNQPVLTQDANQRINNEWSFTKYDAYGRVIITGIHTVAGSRSSLQAIMNGYTQPYEARRSSPLTIDGVDVYYDNNKYPTANVTLHTLNYYDDYTVDYSPTTKPTSVLGQSVVSQVNGLPTVSKIRALGTTQWTTTLTAYDEKDRAIYIDSYSDFLQSRDIAQSLLDFSGRALESETQHLKTGKPAIVTKDYFTYDLMGRLLTHHQQIDNEKVQLIASNGYDDIGQLVDKGVGGISILNGYTDLEQVDVTADGTITHSGGSGIWPAKAKTQGTIPSDFDGGMDLVINQTNRHVRFGLVESANGAQSNSYYDYGFEADNNVLSPKVRVIIQGSLEPGSWTYATGDLFRVEREGNQMKFYQGNTVLHTEPLSQAQEESALFGKVSFNGASGGSVSHLHMFGPLLDNKLQRVDYAYNVRGWLTDINDVEASTSFGKGLDQYSDLFNFKINYNNIDGATGATPLYNGNIAQTLWKTENDDKNVRGYAYLYDDLNRIQGATGYKGATINTMTTYNYHDVHNISYDRNGNLLSLTRKGANDTDTASGNWDILSYAYDGSSNKLLNVLDNSTDTNYKGHGFLDGNIEGVTGYDDYEYDANGNMEVDRNKGINTITYNHLNLPETVTINNGLESGTITYVYDAAGTKLKKTVAITGLTAKNILYVGGYVYEDNELQFFPHPEGYVEPVAGTSKSIGISIGGTTSYTAYNYVFQYKDHLGNVRLSYTDSDGNGSVGTGEIIEESNYYPFGLEQSGYNVNVSGGNSLAQNYKYNGKELNSELGLEWYDYGARNYDASLGRWMNIDPLAEKYAHFTPYHYVYNNPINFIDPDGEEGIVVSGQPGDHKNKEHFLANGLDRARAAQGRVQDKNEKVTWIVFNDGSKEHGHSPAQLKEYRKKAEEAGINFKVVDNVDSIVDYINDKDGGDTRKNDRISSFYYVGHATPGDLDVGYPDSGNFEPDDLDPDAFRSAAWVNCTGGCRTSVPGVFEDSVVTQFAEILDELSTVYGVDVRVYYGGGVQSDEELMKKNDGKHVKKKGERSVKEEDKKKN
ncbi:MAG: hypothetical protein Aureis2KO_32000 [Aureisphaera sp.]